MIENDEKGPDSWVVDPNLMLLGTQSYNMSSNSVSEQ